MDYYVYNRADEVIGVLQSFSSLRWELPYAKSGEVELHVPYSKENCELLEQADRIVRSGDGVICFINVFWPHPKSSGAPDIEIHGRTDNLDRRIIRRTATISNLNQIPALFQKELRGLNLDLTGPAANASFEAFDVTWKTFRDVLEQACPLCGGGYRMKVHGGKINVLEIYQRGENEDVAFREDMDTLVSLDRMLDESSWYNYAYIAGEGEGADRTVVELDTRKSQTEERREVYIDARDLQSAYRDETGKEVIRTADEYKKLLLARGRTKLAESYAREEVFTAESSLVTETAVYGSTAGNGYLEGDIVAVSGYKYGNVHGYKRINSVTFVEQDGLHYILPEFTEP